jgi:O-antigen/teichoic acid export membrane protein
LPVRGRLVRNLFHLGVSQVTTTVLQMVVNAAIARSLGAAEYGVLYLLNTISGLGYVFVDWGHGPYVTREVALHPRRSGDLMGSVLVIRAATAGIMAALALLATWLLNYELRVRVLAVVMVLTLMPQYLALSYTWVFRGRERMEFDALLQIVLRLTGLALVLACLALGGRLLGIMMTYVIAGTVTFALAIVLYNRLGFPPLQVSRATARELVFDGAPMLAISLAIAVQPTIDANILYKFAPHEVVGWYGGAWIIAGTLVAPASVLGNALFPRLARAFANPDEFRHVLRTAFRPLLMLAVLGCVGTYLFADFAISVAYSHQKFGRAGEVLKAFAPALTLIYLDMLLGYSILAAGKAGQLAKAKFLAVVVTTGLELFLVSWFQTRYSNGGIGVALALAAGELVMLGAAAVLLREFVGRAMLLDVVKALLSGVVTMGVMLSLPPITPLIGIPLCVALFGFVSFLSGAINNADLQLLGTAVRKAA